MSVGDVILGAGIGLAAAVVVSAIQLIILALTGRRKPDSGVPISAFRRSNQANPRR